MNDEVAGVLGEVQVSASAPVDLHNGTSATIEAWPDVVQLDTYDSATFVDISSQTLSYEEYESLRQANPHIDYPELEKPEPDSEERNPNSGPTPAGTPTGNVAVSLEPNVTNARVYALQLGQPAQHQPQGLKENAQHLAGAAVGAVQSAGSGALAVAQYASDSLWQLGDLATGGYFRDTALMQGVWQRQQGRGEAIIGAASSPLETAAGVVNDIQARGQQAEALRASGEFYEAGKIAGALALDLNPAGGAAGMVRRLPDGPPASATRHGSDGVVITAKPRGGAWDYAPNWDKWRENGGTVTPHADGSVTYTRSDGVAVTYNRDGYPDFSPHARESIPLDSLQFDHRNDFRRANEAIGYPGSKPPAGYTWHHHQDGRTMQLVPQDIHNANRGGFAHMGEGVSTSRE